MLGSLVRRPSLGLLLRPTVPCTIISVRAKRFCTTDGNENGRKEDELVIDPEIIDQMVEMVEKNGPDQLFGGSDWLKYRVDRFGLGGTEGVEEWRNQRLEDKVIGLFKEVLNMNNTPGTPLHPLDIKMREGAMAANERLNVKLSELSLQNPEKFGKIRDFYLGMQTQIDKKEQEEYQSLTEGVLPGSLTPPWVGGGLIWKRFFDDVLAEMTNRNFHEHYDESFATLEYQEQPPEINHAINAARLPMQPLGYFHTPIPLLRPFLTLLDRETIRTVG
eukprot:TRINITY_DN7255_c0_g2_i3.p1 TRINITY_DN7255_c0_g2~~TRINITY_DN7255_c0_g2_i3.p1  ORF type:complete len:275 (-),score=56.14 TRINITY_DN7255_c0_g2_i3:567-1391(-)